MAEIKPLTEWVRTPRSLTRKYCLSGPLAFGLLEWFAVWIEGETIVQFHGMGPWVINYVNPADDPRNKSEVRK